MLEVFITQTQVENEGVNKKDYFPLFKWYYITKSEIDLWLKFLFIPLLSGCV